MKPIWWIIAALLVVILLVVVAAVWSVTGFNLLSGSQAPPPGSFVYTNTVPVNTEPPLEAIYLSWVDSNGMLSGQAQDARVTGNSPGNEQVHSTHTSFSGQWANGQVSLNFGGFLGFTNTVTGSYSGAGNLTLNMPSQDGSLSAYIFKPATIVDYNSAVSALDIQANNMNATAAANQATVDATNAAATAIASQQQAVSQANTRLGTALSALNTEAYGLAAFDETSTLNGYVDDWQSMQNDYQTEVNDSHQGCANNNGSQVQSDATQVQSDATQIQADDTQLKAGTTQYNTDVAAVQNDMQAVKNDWGQLRQAVANNTTHEPSAAYTQTDVTNALQAGQNALDKAHGVLTSAQHAAGVYDSEANSLNNQAQAIPGKMGC